MSCLVLYIYVCIYIEDDENNEAFHESLVGVMMNHEVFPQIVNHLDRVFAVPQIYGMIVSS